MKGIGAYHLHAAKMHLSDLGSIEFPQFSSALGNKTRDRAIDFERKAHSNPVEQNSAGRAQGCRDNRVCQQVQQGNTVGNNT